MVKLLLNMIRRIHRYILRYHNPVTYARAIGVHVGENCRILGLGSGTSFGSEPYMISVGDHVTIAAGVTFITHDGGVWIFREQHPEIDVVAPIVVGNNVFIGVHSIIMPGVTIGDNCVIGAGSVVTRDIPAGSVAVGAPARRIKSIEEYWTKIKDRAVFVRSLPDDEKRLVYQSLAGVKHNL